MQLSSGSSYLWVFGATFTDDAFPSQTEETQDEMVQSLGKEQPPRDSMGLGLSRNHKEVPFCLHPSKLEQQTEIPATPEKRHAERSQTLSFPGSLISLKSDTRELAESWILKF